MIYTIGILVVIASRVIYAGMKSDQLFYRNPKSYEITIKDYPKDARVLDEGKVASFLGLTLLGSITWPLVVPALGLFKLGQKYAKVRTSR